MKQPVFLLLMCLGLLALPTKAAGPSVAECKKMVLAAEKVPDPTVYDKCGFGNSKRAFNTWATFAYKSRSPRALYEICKRYQTTPNVEYYCLKSAELGFLPAMIWSGDFYAKKGLYEKALPFYLRAAENPALDNIDEKGRLQENLGLLYLEPSFSFYSPAKAISFLKKAALNRKPLSNNLLAVFSATQQNGLVKDDKEVLTYLWRAILLNCPTAQINLGLYQLGAQEKLSWDMVREKIQNGMYSCALTTQLADIEQYNQTYQKQQDCNCQSVVMTEEKYQSKPYLVLSINDKEAELQAKDGQKITVKSGDTLPDDIIVSEVRKSAVLLRQRNERIILNLYVKDPCYDFCQPLMTGEKLSEDMLTIKPYLITFTPQECEDITYYAEKLVDTNLDYFGKKECASQKKE